MLKLCGKFQARTAFLLHLDWSSTANSIASIQEQGPVLFLQNVQRMKMILFQDYGLLLLAVDQGVEIDSVDVEDAVCRQKSHGELWSGNGHHY